MSNIRDIMDVDVEPLEAQASQRSKESTTTAPYSTRSVEEPPSPSTDTKGKGPSSTSRRKSTRSTKTSKDTSATRRRRSHSGASIESHDPSATPIRGETGSSSQSRNEMDLPVKYTPVTGRISRAKKGVPVHNCEHCGKVFTRAEHLRRHQLSHSKPSFQCTYQDCERVFHRADLLARHYSRHETQGEKPWKASSSSRTHSRSPSAASEGRQIKSEDMISPTDSLTPTGRHEIPRSGYQQPTSYMTGNPGFQTTGPSDGLAHELSFSPQVLPQGDMPGVRYVDIISSSDPFSSLTPPTLQIPSEYPSFYSATDNNYSSTESAYSTPSPATSGYRNAFHRDRSASITTQADILPWSPSGAALPPQIPRGMEAMPESYGYTSPIMSPLISTQMVPIDGGFEVVGTPTTLSAFQKSHFPAFPASASPVRNKRVGSIDGGQKIFLDSHRLIPLNGFLGVPSFAEQVRRHLDVYWHRIDPFFPIVHPSTFDLNISPVLTLSMAALGTQFSNRTEDRALGTDLHTRAKQMIKEFPSWDLNTMRAILLTEVFARFRSPAIDVRPSRVFKELYHRFVNNAEHSAIFTQLNSNVLNSQGSISGDQSSLWLQWTQYETKQRIRASCFMFDTLRSVSFEQPNLNASFDVPLSLPCTQRLWHAQSEKEWKQMLLSQDCTPPVLSRDCSSPMNLDKACLETPFTKSVTLAYLISEVPGKNVGASAKAINSNVFLKSIAVNFDSNTEAHTYAMLKHAPVKDILAVTGDTWVLGRKTTSPAEFHAIAPRLRAWVHSAASSKAVWHACQVLSIGIRATEAEHSSNLGVFEFWNFYMAALICWTFGHRYNHNTNGGLSTNGSLPVSELSSLACSRRNSAALSSTSDDAAARKQAALAYTEEMLSLPWEQLQGCIVRNDTGPLLDFVRLRLQEDELGSCCGLLVDAIRVLGKLGRESKTLF